MSLPSDNVHMLRVAGTQNGRIFLCGRDGCLYELAYQAEDGWFSRKCRKVNHSQSPLSSLVPTFLRCVTPCVCMYVYVHICVYVDVDVDVCIYVCVCACVCMCMCVCVCVCAHVCVCVCVCICMCMRM